MHIVANKAWAEKNPAAAKLFSIMKLPIADINAENAMMHEGQRLKRIFKATSTAGSKPTSSSLTAG
jgi:ABC-type proline/glycine betaine transport system substrate-binding protein